jgi:transposase
MTLGGADVTDEQDSGRRPRGVKGRYEHTMADAERDATAARLRARGLTYRRIAAELGVDVATAHRAVKRALEATVAEPAAEVRQLELERLDTELERLAELEERVREVLEAKHVTVQHGAVVQLDGQPLPDDGPVLAAADRLLKIEDARRRKGERRARLLGLDAPQKVETSGQVRYEVVGVDPAALS